MVTMAGARNLLAIRMGSVIGATGFEDPAGVGAFDLVESQNRRFRRQLADRERFSVYGLSLHQKSCPAMKARKNRISEKRQEGV
jgi:hypothetical protein